MRKLKPPKTTYQVVYGPDCHCRHHHRSIKAAIKCMRKKRLTCFRICKYTEGYPYGSNLPLTEAEKEEYRKAMEGP